MSGFWFGKKVSLLSASLAESGAEFLRMELEARELGHDACRLDDSMYFLFVEKGFPVCQVNQDRVYLAAGEGVFINRRTAWRLTEGSAGENILTVVRITEEYFGEEQHGFFKEKYVNPLTRSVEFPYLKLEKNVALHREAVHALEKAARAAAKEEVCFEMEVRGYVYQAWSGIFREFVRLSPVLKKAARREKDRLQDILTYLHEHYRDKIALKELAVHCGISSGECCRFFKKHMGQSPFEYLQVYRIQQSMPELLEKAGSIGEISRRHGFHGSSYYAEMFKKEMGCAPGDYRKWYRAKDGAVCPLKMAFLSEERDAAEEAPRPEAHRPEAMPAHLL